MSCEQNEPVRCVLRLFGASALGVQQAASAFPPEWCVTAQCRSRGAETLIALRSENAAGLPAAVCTAALRLTCTEKGTRTLPPPWCRRWSTAVGCWCARMLPPGP